MDYDITLSIEVPTTALDEERIVALVSRALSAEGAAEGASVSVVLTDDAAVHALNREYRGVDAPTDVLSFGLSEAAQTAGEAEPDDFVLPPDAALQLGEVIVSHETAERQAVTHQREPGHELAHLIVHGVLHLLGHDHADPDDESRMRAREDEVLTARGFPPGTAGWDYPHSG